MSEGEEQVSAEMGEHADTTGGTPGYEDFTTAHL